MKITTYNSSGLNQQRIDFISDYLSQTSTDFLLVQETWLYTSQLALLSDLHNEYMAYGVCGMPERSAVIGGRPFGGVAILWHQSLAASVKPLKSSCNRLCAVTVSLSRCKILLVNLYMPCDNYSRTLIDPDFQDVLDATLCLWIESDADSLIIGGDLNTDFRRGNAHSDALCTFINNVNGALACRCFDNDFIDTYVSYDGRSSSCIDHFIVSKSLVSNVSNVNVYDHVLNKSTHSPLCMDVDISVYKRALGAPLVSSVKSIAWGRVTSEHIERFQMSVSMALNERIMPECLTACSGNVCSNPVHKVQIDEFCEVLCNICIRSGHSSFPTCQPKEFRRPKWKELMQPYKDEALFWDTMWKSCGKPAVGVVFDIRQRTKREYHYAMRRYKKSESRLRRERMGDLMLERDNRNFWKEVGKIAHKKNVVAPVVDGVAADNEIAEVFAHKYSQLYNSVPSDTNDMREIENELNEALENAASATDFVVSASELDSAIKKLKSQKHDGNASMWSNFVIWSPSCMRVQIRLLFGAMLSHGHFPHMLNKAIIISIPKDLKGDICDSANYRGIALTSCLTKLLEIVLIDKARMNISTSHLQFAYKAKYSTSMCTLILKETAKHFLERGSEVFCCLIDASKAFDRLRHDRLFRLLVERGVPPAVTRLLMVSYRQQDLRTRWLSAVSGSFNALNGVKQGGIFSPILFSLYMDILIGRLESLGIGCHVGNNFVGAFCYADDLTLLCPSLKGLQTMLNVCETFAKEYDLQFNPKKSECIHFNQHNASNSQFQIFLNESQVKWVSKVKHLGNYIDCNMNDSTDVKAKCGDFVYRVNSLRSNFSCVDTNVLTRLFKSFCCSFYGSQTWILGCNEMQHVYTTYNRGIRILLKLPFRTHRALLPLLINSLPLETQFCHRFYRLYVKMTNIPRIDSIVRVFCSDPRSIISRNLYKCQNIPEIEHDDSQFTIAAAILEVIEILNSSLEIEHFTISEMEHFLEHLCTE